MRTFLILFRICVFPCSRAASLLGSSGGRLLILVGQRQPVIWRDRENESVPHQYGFWYCLFTNIVLFRICVFPCSRAASVLGSSGGRLGSLVFADAKSASGKKLGSKNTIEGKRTIFGVFLYERTSFLLYVGPLLSNLVYLSLTTKRVSDNQTSEHIELPKINVNLLYRANPFCHPLWPWHGCPPLMRRRPRENAPHD
jgi:hypothetical protein